MGNCCRFHLKADAEKDTKEIVGVENDAASICDEQTIHVGITPFVTNFQPKLESPPPTPPFPDNTAKVVVAVYDYDARLDDDLSFVKGDLLEIREEATDWWYARSRKNGKKGYIPGNYVAPIQTLEAEPWYFGDIKRHDAEKLLMQIGCQDGAFLIRKSENKNGQVSNCFALSVRDKELIRHYRIKITDSGKYFISLSKEFTTLNELIEFYKISSDGLKIKLLEPCGKTQAQTFGLSHKDKWEISRDSLEFQSPVGSGQFGDVYKGVWNSKIPVAIKSLKPGFMDKKQFLAEANLMKQLRHPKLVQLYAVVTIEEPLLIVTEFMSNGSLLEFLRYNKSQKLLFKELIDICAEVAQGMAYLELKSYIHRDLAARNILVGEHNLVKIADFGLSRCVVDGDGEYSALQASHLPIKWTAPESCLYNRFTIKSDVWSFGILMYEVITYGRTPYSGMTNTEALRKIQNGYRLPCPDGCPIEFYNIMLNTWNDIPEERPSFETLQWILEDWFQENKYANNL
ncbi:tyrosine-protein kinase SRK2 [Hydra vulgaris]|uniref:Tyrosine-protein kinase n=1 Tax=Hydra vulgaris TaxID=6087 RepID=A0ABM4D8D0_HYDVU